MAREISEGDFQTLEAAADIIMRLKRSATSGPRTPTQSKPIPGTWRECSSGDLEPGKKGDCMLWVDAEDYDKTIAGFHVQHEGRAIPLKVARSFQIPKIGRAGYQLYHEATGTRDNEGIMRLLTNDYV